MDCREDQVSEKSILERLMECPRSGVWIHKKTQRRYLVICCCVIEKTLEPGVLYIALPHEDDCDRACKENIKTDRGECVMWHRPLSEWNEKFKKA